MRDALAEYDIVIELAMSGGRDFELVSKPDTMTDMAFGETLRQVQESLLPTVDGPWTFDISLE